MRHNLAWRRCRTCGQLTLVTSPDGVCADCGAPMAALDAHRPSPARRRAVTPARRSPPPRPRVPDLTPADDAVAKRLLASVFPEGAGL